MTLEEIKELNDKEYLDKYKQLKKQWIYEARKLHQTNSDQIAIIDEMIDKCDSINQVDKFVSLISQRVKVGLTFDEAPTVRNNSIYVLDKDEELSFNGDVKSPKHKLIIGDNYDALNNLLVTHRKVIDIILLKECFSFYLSINKQKSF